MRDIIDIKKEALRELSIQVSQFITSEEWVEAIRYQTVIIGLYPNSRNYADRAELHEADGNILAATQDYTASIKFYPKSTKYEARANAYAKIGQYDHAMRDIRDGTLLQRLEIERGTFISMPPPLRIKF